MNEPLQPPQSPRRPGRGLRLALILSLMVNVLVIGVLAGGVLRVARFDPMVSGQPDMRALWRALPGEVRSDMRQMARTQGFGAAHEAREDHDERRARTAALNARMIEALRAEPFDPAGFVAIMSGERDHMTSRLDAAHGALAERIGTLTQAQRQTMAEAFAQGLREPLRR